jgi:hypothetical protein
MVAAESRRFAIWSLTPMNGNVAIEGLLARVLRQRDYEPHVIRCNGGRERCNTDMTNPTIGSRTFLCLSCSSGAEQRTAEWAGEHLPTSWLTDWIDQDRLDQAYATVAATADEDLWTFVYDGVPFGSWLDVALRLEYFGENWQSLPNLAEVGRAWLRSTLVIWAAAHGYFATERPAGVVALSGLLPGDKALMAVAERYGVRCVFYEGGQKPGSIILRHNEPACRYEFAAEWAQWADVPLSVAESARLDTFLRSRRSHGANMTYVYSPPSSDDLQQVRQSLGLTGDRPVLVAFTGLVVDSAVFEAHDVFASQGQWLEALVTFAEGRPDLDLVIRVHPVERTSVRFAGAEVVTVRDPAAEVIARRWPQLPPNVRVVGSDDAISSYDLIQLARVVLTYISTVSIEAAAAGKPLLAAGRSHYRPVGLAWPVESAETFGAQIAALMADPVAPPQAAEIARRYAYFWFLRATPQLPGLPFEVEQIVAAPPSPLPYWEGAGDAGDLSRIADFLTGAGPFVTPPAAMRHRDQGVPMPVTMPAHPILIVWAADWTAEALAAEVLRPAGQQRRPWQIVLVTALDRMRDLAACSREAARMAGFSADALRLVPLDPDDGLDPTWCLLASAYVPPRDGSGLAHDLAKAYGWPQWDQVWSRHPAGSVS